jgi:hypothetical protein
MMNREKYGMMTSLELLFQQSPGWVYKTAEIPWNNWFSASKVRCSNVVPARFCRHCKQEVLG